MPKDDSFYVRVPTIGDENKKDYRKSLTEEIAESLKINQDDEETEKLGFFGKSYAYFDKAMRKYK